MLGSGGIERCDHAIVVTADFAPGETIADFDDLSGGNNIFLNIVLTADTAEIDQLNKIDIHSIHQTAFGADLDLGEQTVTAKHGHIGGGRALPINSVSSSKRKYDSGVSLFTKPKDSASPSS